MKDLVELALPVRSFIDLQEEKEAIKKAIRTQKFVISQLFLSAGTIARNSVFLVNEFTVQEINDAIERLCEQTLLTQSDDFETLFLDNKNSLGLYTALAKIYGFLLEGEITDWVVKALESEYHINHINENFVSEIQRIKGGLVLSPKQVDEVILLLKWSPGALNWSLNSQETLINSSQMDLVNIDTQKEANLLYTNYFLSGLYTFFKYDFCNPLLHTHFYTVYGLREIETLQELIIKSSTGIELKSQFTERQHIIAPGKISTDLDVDPLIMITIFDSSSEPWESTTEVEKNFET